MTGELPTMGAEAPFAPIPETSLVPFEEPNKVIHGMLERVLGVTRMERTGLDQSQVEGFFSDVVLPAIEATYVAQNSKASRPRTEEQVRVYLDARREEISLMTKGLSYEEIGQKVGRGALTVKTNIRERFNALYQEYSVDGVYDPTYFHEQFLVRYPGVSIAEKPPYVRVSRAKPSLALVPMGSGEATPDVQTTTSIRSQARRPKTNQLAKAADREADNDAEGPTEDLVRLYLNGIGKTALLTAEQEVDLAKRIEAGLFASEALETSPVLSVERRRDLQQIARDGERAKDHFIRANLGLVVSIAKRYAGRGVAFLDLIQEGNLGLIRAVEKFDYTEGTKFSTYAVSWIRKAVRIGFYEQGRAIHLPIHMVEKINTLERIQRELYQDLGRAATLAELENETGIPKNKIVEMLDDARGLIRLDEPVGDSEGTTFGDFIEDRKAPGTEEAVSASGLRDDIGKALATLSEREEMVVRLYYGLDGSPPRTYAEVGAQLGWKPRAVSYIGDSALRKLRASDYATGLLHGYAS